LIISLRPVAIFEGVPASLVLVEVLEEESLELVVVELVVVELVEVSTWADGVLVAPSPAAGVLAPVASLAAGAGGGGGGCVSRSVGPEPRPSASRVAGPTTPSTGSPFAAWKASTAVLVCEPNVPSAGTWSNACSWLTPPPTAGCVPTTASLTVAVVVASVLAVATVLGAVAVVPPLSAVVVASVLAVVV
jgi:hypothetical protein